MDTDVKQLLDRAWHAYSVGKPFMSDVEFDVLAEAYEYEGFTEGTISKKANHRFQMYSLQKVFDDDPAPSTIQVYKTIETLKLDGAAISLYYSRGQLVKGITRGDGIEGEDITEKVYNISSIPQMVDQLDNHQIDGEIVCSNNTENSRNFASGALHTKDIDEFINEKSKKLTFIAYRVMPMTLTDFYEEDMMCLYNYGFNTVIHLNDYDNYPTDGKVIRINNNEIYGKLGTTAKHPRGAYARKLSSDVAIEETELLEVKWQVGKSGKVTPVAIFSEIIIDDARINRATLHNVGFIEDMGLEIGDTILVTRSGGIIPKVLGKL